MFNIRALHGIDIFQEIILSHSKCHKIFNEYSNKNKYADWGCSKDFLNPWLKLMLNKSKTF